MQGVCFDIIRVMQNEEDFAVPGLSRGIHILELLAKRPEGLTQSEIAQALSIPFASVSRITNQLETMGYLLRHPQSKAFRLSMRMMMVGQRALIGLDTMELAIPVMRQIRDEMQDTVALGVIQGTNVVVVESVPGTHPFIFTLNPGFTGQIHVTAPGKAIMAWYDLTRRNALLDQMRFKRYNERTITTRTAFEKELDRTRQRGWALDNAEEYDGVYCIAVPLLDRTGFPLAAIGIVLKAERLPLNTGVGICLGMMPLLAYNYSSGNRKRMRQVWNFSRIVGLTFALICVVLYRLFASEIMGAFIQDEATVRYGTQFLQARCFATPMMFLCFSMVHYMQAIGKGKESFILALVRQLVFNIPILFLMNHLYGMSGIVWTQLIADCFTVAFSYLLYFKVRKAEGL